MPGDFGQYIGQGAGFVATGRGQRRPGFDPRHQVGGVSFDQQALRRNVGDKAVQMLPPAFVAYPAGNAQMQVQIQIAKRLFPGAGETMHHSIAEFIPVVPENIV